MYIAKARVFGKRGLLVVALGFFTAGPGVRVASATSGHPSAHSLLSSRNLWATVDMCSPTDQPHTVGLRGSMPSDMHPKDEMYMRFQLQYLNASTQQWVDLGSSADSGFLKLGASTSVRQAGRTFELVPPAGTSTYELRGYLEFQWRRGKTVVHSATRTTTSGHTSLAGADPANYSAATCELK